MSDLRALIEPPRPMRQHRRPGQGLGGRVTSSRSGKRGVRDRRRRSVLGAGAAKMLALGALGGSVTVGIARRRCSWARTGPATDCERRRTCAGRSDPLSAAIARACRHRR
jgi:hypothetical protein